MHSLYIHIPFCRKACHYCDFHFSTSLKYQAPMVEAICKELILRKNEASTPLRTIYLGGGTPSVLQEDELSLIFSTIEKNYSIEKNTEITIEVNPDDFPQQTCNQKLYFYRCLGINRLSIGIQSFFDEHLQLMNRSHSAQQARTLLEHSKKHFDNISLDLIYAIPQMTLSQWEYNIAQALYFQVPHLSAYSLTVEENTALSHFIRQGKIPPPNDDAAHEQFFLMKQLLHEKEYEHYELSNFGKKGYFSQNNTAYWTQMPYIGIGPSAHSFNGNTRRWNIAHNLKYLHALQNNQLLYQEETLSLHEKYNERILTGLRIRQGINLAVLKKQFGDKLYEYLLSEAQPHLAQKLLCIENDHLRTTDKGLFLSDGIAASLFWVE